MKQLNKIILIGVLALTVMASSCSQGKLFGKKSNCGCPNKKGFVGY